MSTLQIALLLAAVGAAAVILTLAAREPGIRPRPVRVTFLSVATIFALLAALSACGPAAPGIEPSPVPPAEETPTLGPVFTPTATPFVDPPVVNCFELLMQGPWILQGAANGDAQPGYLQELDGRLEGTEVLQIILDIHGQSFDEGDLKDEAAIIIDQPEGQWTLASVVTHGLDNGMEGLQAVYIPLTDFMSIDSQGNAGVVLDLNQPYGPIHARFWNETDFTVEISSIMACNYQRV